MPEPIKTFDIWVEGYAATGDRGPHRLLARGVAGRNFLDAVLRWWRSLDEKELSKEDFYGNLRIEGGHAYLWGCELFDNASDAARSFG